MPKNISQALIAAKSDKDRRSVCEQWLQHLNVAGLTKHLTSSAAIGVIEQFTYLNCDFAFKHKLSETKLVCFMEIMFYILKMLINKRLTEDESYEAFKDLLLRHAIQRPPHSLAIFNLGDVKKIDLFVQDTYFKHYSMYAYVLTVKDMLQLQTKTVFESKELTIIDSLNQGVEVAARDIDEIYQYLSPEECAEFERQKENAILASN